MKKWRPAGILIVILTLSLAVCGCSEKENQADRPGSVAGAVETIPLPEPSQAEEDVPVTEKYHDVKEEWQQKIDSALPGIVCWGDSISFGECGEGVTYPDELKKIIDRELIDPVRIRSGIDSLKTPDVLNMGIDSERTLDIAVRQGGIGMVTTEPFTVPSRNEAVPVSLKFDWNHAAHQGNMRTDPESVPNDTLERPMIMIDGEAGVNSVTIEVDQDGKKTVEGRLVRLFDKNRSESVYYFSRIDTKDEKRKPSKPVEVPAGTAVRTYGARNYQDYLQIFQMGGNGGFTNAEDLRAQFQAMIDYSYPELPSGREKRYLCIGMGREDSETNRSGKLRTDQEEYLEAKLGPYFISFRKELSNASGPELAGLDLSPADLEACAKGDIPPSLLAEDGLHYNPHGYEIIAEMIYRKLDEFGYFDELKALAQ